MKNIYHIVTDTFIQIMEKRIEGKWERPWISLNAGLAQNPYSETVYSGLNQFYLSLNCYLGNYSINKWLTFLQVQALNGKIKKGEQGTEIFFTDSCYYTAAGTKVKKEIAEMMSDKEKANLKKVIFYKYFNVWNVEQIENISPEFYTEEEMHKRNVWDANATAEKVILNTAATVIYKPQNRAYYNVSKDEIVLPEKVQFNGDAGFYSTAFHELAHWTGHSSRLNRPTLTGKGNENYMKEELTAELGSAFICAELGIELDMPNNAKYLQYWIDALKENNRYIFSVASKSQAACKFVLKHSDNYRIAA